MRRLLLRCLPAVLLSVGLLTLAACQIARPRPPVPAERIVSLGFEDVVTDRARLDQLTSRLTEVGATGVSISVGRSDWTAFPWPALRAAESAEVRRTGADYVAAAMEVLATDPNGRRRTINLAIDALVPRWIEQDPSLAGGATSSPQSSGVGGWARVARRPSSRGRLAGTVDTVDGHFIWHGLRRAHTELSS